MAHVSEDRVLETTTTTGTGALTLAGAVTGFRAFGSVMTSPTIPAGMRCGPWTRTATRRAITRRPRHLFGVEHADPHHGAALKQRQRRRYAGGRHQIRRNRVALTARAAARRRAGGSTDQRIRRPAAPASGGLLIYSREIIPGHTVLKTLRPVRSR